MLSKKCRRISTRITYIAIPVVIAVALTFSERVIPCGSIQGNGLVTVVFCVVSCSGTTRHTLRTISLVTLKRVCAVIVRVAVAFACLKRISDCVPLIALQDKLSCRRLVTVVFASHTHPSAAWNVLITGSLKAV
jgi:hypothetical protein